MLIQLKFKNFKSFKNETILDMTATSITEHPYNLINVNNNEKYIKVAAIYGANASGKSSIIQAFAFMQSCINDSFKNASDNEDIPLKRFAFDFKCRKEPAEFEVFFKSKDNQEYQYGFSLDNNKIYEEWFYIKKDNNKDTEDTYIPLFERAGSNIECSDLLKGASNFIPMVKDKTLFLSILSNAKIPHIEQVLTLFAIRVMDYGDIKFEQALTQVYSPYIERKSFQKDLTTFLRAIDINIEDIIIEKVKEEHVNSPDYKIFTKHLMTDNKTYYKMPLAEESSGTQKLFSLFFFLHCSFKIGCPIFIDELDSKLHPLLLRYILTLFQDETINKNGTQLIYATHDNYTLSKDIFRRDQIWFVEKNKNAVSDLYSLAEYKFDDDKKVRKDASYNKDYLLGKYGAVPILRGYDMWGNHDEKTK